MAHRSQPDSPCIDPATLAALRRGALSAPEEATLARHAEGCPTCRDLLEPRARIIPFPRRGIPAEAVPAGPRERRWIAALVAMMAFVGGIVVGQLLWEVQRPARVLSILEQRVPVSDVVHLEDTALSLLRFQGHPLRLSAQRAPTPADPPPAPLPVDRRWLELALLEALELSRDAALLHRLAFLTIAHAEGRGDLLRALLALEVARTRAPESVALLNDLAAVTLAVEERDHEEARMLLEQAVALEPDLRPALFNLAVVARASGSVTEEEEAITRYLAVEPASPWSVPMRERYDSLEATMGPLPAP